MTEPVRYLPLLEQFDRWQAGAKTRHPGVIPCRAGCTACCHGPFDISVADAVLVRDAAARLEPAVRARVLEAAADQMRQALAIEPGWSPPYDIGAIGEARFDRISDALAHLPCPLLDASGNCLVYHDRPMICRLMGLGLVTEAGDVIENGCPIQERFPGYEALAPEPFPLEAWEEAEEPAKIAAAVAWFGDATRADFESTIAGALTAG